MKKYVVIIILVVIAIFIGNTLYRAGSFKSIKNHSELNDIKVYTSLAGPEDFDIDKENGWMFISATDRWKLARGEKGNDGIFLFYPEKNIAPRKLITTYSGEFHPHGISYLKKDGENYLFVINHNKEGSSVELFRYKNDTLFHLVSIKDKMMCCPNDLVAVDTDKFYVSNDHGKKKGLMRTLEDYLRLPNSYLLYFDGRQFSKVYDKLNYGNGVAVSNDKKTIYLTETTGSKISVFDRNPATGKLTFRFDKNLNTGLDNITIDAEDNLWVAAHPKLFDFVGHAKNPEKKSPSQVFKLEPKGLSDLTVTEVYLNDGTQISGSSVALHYHDKVYVGCVFENKFLQGDYQVDKR